MTGTEHSAALMDRIRSRKAVVGVIGLGYVGLPLALAAIEAGFRRKTWTAPHDIERLADALMRRYTTDELDDLAKRIA